MNITFLDAGNEFSDAPKTLPELLRCLKYCKDHKTPREDGIPYEFTKNLFQKWLLYLCHLFNKMLSKEISFVTWRNTGLPMLHKKGSKNDPVNYRGTKSIFPYTSQKAYNMVP
ncbi:hypothetical protein JTB14_001482 [Gonioctena quinquepunctata]|nr:hypothetical protein JTB14_001482 [Gonioctena quinquepunctata]